MGNHGAHLRRLQVQEHSSQGSYDACKSRSHSGGSQCAVGAQRIEAAVCLDDRGKANQSLNSYINHLTHHEGCCQPNLISSSSSIPPSFLLFDQIYF